MHGLSASNLLRLGFHTQFIQVVTLCKWGLGWFAALHVLGLVSLLVLPMVSTPSDQQSVRVSEQGEYFHVDSETNERIIAWTIQHELTPLETENLWRLIASTGVRQVRELDDRDALVTYAASFSSNREAMFMPLTGTIHLTDMNSLEQFLNEVPHVDQFRRNPSQSYGRGAKIVYLAAVRSLFSEKSFRELQRENYRDPTTLEGEAHGSLKNTLLSRYDLLRFAGDTR